MDQKRGQTRNIGIDSRKPLISYDSSVLNLSGGILENLRCYGSSVANISGDVLIRYQGPPYISPPRSGYFYDSALITLSGGEVLGPMYVQGQSNLKVRGGIVSAVYFGDGSPTVDISGGTIGSLSRGGTSGCLRIIGYDLEAVPYGGVGQQGQVTGYWNDDTSFSIDLYNGAYSIVKLYDGVIPTDCTNRPASDLSGDCKVTFVDFATMASEWLDDGTQ